MAAKQRYNYDWQNKATLPNSKQVLCVLSEMIKNVTHFQSRTQTLWLHQRLLQFIHRPTTAVLLAETGLR